MHQVQSSHETQCAYKETCRLWVPPGQGSADGSIWCCWVLQVTPCTEALLPSEAGKEAALLRVQIKAREATLGARVPRELPTCAGVYCWDKNALRLAFIFSSRFTRWPLLTSSSSVLSSADRSSLWSFRFSAFSSSSIFSAFSAADL